MFGFPIGNGSSGSLDFIQKFTNNADSGFPKSQQREVFYSIKDGNWSDLTIWQTASGRVGLLPTQIDDVYVRNTITLNVGNQRCNNLYISENARFITSIYNISVFGNLKSYGNINLSAAGAKITLYGNDNFVNKHPTFAATSIIEYAGVNQPILDLNYAYLILINAGVKYPLNHINCVRININTNATLNLLWYNLICSESAFIGGSAVSAGTFIANYGNYILSTARAFINNAFVSARNGTIFEFRNGVDSTNMGVNSWDALDATINFTTNNQTLTGGGSTVISVGTMNIYSDIQVTITSVSSLYITKIINGLNANSKLINQGTLTFATQESVDTSMTTGTVDISTLANSLIFNGAYTATIPTRLLPSTISSLQILGSGTKTVSNNITISANLTVTNAATLELSTYDLTVNGTAQFGGPPNTGTLSKNGAGNIKFVGLANLYQCIINLTGNPTTEFVGGIKLFGSIANNFNWGNNLVKFTATQSISDLSSSPNIQFNCPVLISGAITLTILASTNATFVRFTNTLNGDNANSKLLMGGGAALASVTYNAATQPMSVGILDTSTNLNTWIYGNSNQLIKGGIYRNLTFNGGGTKTLQGNVSVINTYTLTSPAILNLNGFTLTNP